METTILDGESLAQEVLAEIRPRIDRLRSDGCRPGLAVLLLGDNPASLSYVAAKTRACVQAGVGCELIRRPFDLSQAALLELLDGLNHDCRYHGILVQQPLPGHIDPGTVTCAVSPEKDVDGLHPSNMGLLLTGEPRFVPCTAAGVQQLLVRSGHDPAGKRVVIVGRSNLVGKPLAALLTRKGPGGDATVTVCHRQTPDLASVTATADILVAAIGSPRFVTRAMVRRGAIVIDVGISRVADPSRRRGYRLMGDVDVADVRGWASAISPVPGGVGPMTVAMLVANTVEAAEHARAGARAWVGSGAH